MPQTPVLYPSGICIQTEKGWFYVLKGKRYRIISQRVLESWNFPRVVASSERAAAGLKVMGKLGFRDGSLIHNLSGGKMYIVSENKKRLIENPDWFYRLGITSDDFLLVSDEETNLHSDGEVLN